MLLQFKTTDDAIFIVDVQTMNWARVSAPGTDPESKVLENGKIIPQGFGVYALEGRRPDDKDIPGAGLSSIGNYVVAIGQTVKIFIRANVEIKDFTMPVPIRQVLYEILPTDPKQIEHTIQEVADADQGRPEITQGKEEPASGGNVAGTETQTEQPEAEATVQPGNENLGRPIIRTLEEDDFAPPVSSQTEQTEGASEPSDRVSNPDSNSSGDNPILV